MNDDEPKPYEPPRLTPIGNAYDVAAPGWREETPEQDPIAVELGAGTGEA